jgi:hypothetical protein
MGSEMADFKVNRECWWKASAAELSGGMALALRLA